MDKKILVKWICITLMCAILFGTIGYSYGMMVSIDNCNYLLIQQEKTNKCDFANQNMVVGTNTNQSRFDYEHINKIMLENFTPFEINITVKP